MREGFKLSLAVNLTLFGLIAIPVLGFTAWYHSSERNEFAFANPVKNPQEIPTEAANLALGASLTELEQASAQSNEHVAFFTENARGRSVAN